ncbi:MAG: hypothetical protein ACJ798_05505 [Phenylobacterium sp.]
MITRLVAVAALALVCATAAQAAPRAYHAPRTAYGQPDLQGFWTNGSQTRLERAPGEPLSFATLAQEKAYAAGHTEAWNRGEADGLGQGVSEWHHDYGPARVAGRLRTSYLVAPADGRLPWRPDAKARFDAAVANQNGEAADGPEQRSVLDRCLVGGGGGVGPPMMTPNSAAGRQIVQTRDAVAILSELNHDVRIVHLGGKHLPLALRPWMGDSIGRWEGETLVVETIGFHPEEGFRAQFLMSPDTRVTERFTRISPTQILYAFEVDDPANYTAVWKGEAPFDADRGPLYEFACHEGDRDLEQFLAAARRREAAATAGAAPTR